MYLVRWKGKDPATQMPWADSYQPEANVTKDLVCEYNSTLREAESRSVEIDVLPLICPTPTGAALRHRRGRPQRRSAQPEKRTFQEAGCGEVPQRERPAGGRRRPRGARPAAAGAPTVRRGMAGRGQPLGRPRAAAPRLAQRARAWCRACATRRAVHVAAVCRVYVDVCGPAAGRGEQQGRIHV